MVEKKQRRGTKFAWLAWLFFFLVGVLGVVSVCLSGLNTGYARSFLNAQVLFVVPTCVAAMVFLLIRLCTCWVKKAKTMYRVNVASMILLIVAYVSLYALIFAETFGIVYSHHQDVLSGKPEYQNEYGFLSLFTGVNDWLVWIYLFGPILPIVLYIPMYILMVHDAKGVRIDIKAAKAEKKKAKAEKLAEAKVRKEEEKKALEARKEQERIAKEAEKEAERKALEEKKAALIAQREAEKETKKQEEAKRKENAPKVKVSAPAIAAVITKPKEETASAKPTEKDERGYKPVYLSFLLVSLLTLLIQFLSIPGATRAHGDWNYDGTVFNVKNFICDSEFTLLSVFVAAIYLIVNVIFILIAAYNTKKIRLSLRVLVFSSLASEAIAALLNFMCLSIDSSSSMGYGLTMLLLPILLLIATIVLLCVYKKKRRIQTYICFGAIALLLISEAITNCLPQYTYWIISNTPGGKLVPAIVMAVLWILAAAALIVFSKKLSDGYLLADSLPRRAKPKAPTNEEKLEALRKEYDQATKDGDADKIASLGAQITELEKKAKKEEKSGKSHFDGKLLQLIGYRLLGWLITGITFGIGYPWAVCFVEKWSTKHQVIDGKRLSFDGKGIQLFGKYIVWFLLTLITFGIYGLWLAIKMKKWTVSHSHLKDRQEGAQSESHFDGKLLQLIGYNILSWIIIGITFGIAYPWAVCLKLRWESKHMIIDGKRLTFDGKGIQLFGKYIVWFLLSLITFGIYLLWLAIKMKKWTVSHIHFENNEEESEHENCVCASHNATAESERKQTNSTWTCPKCGKAENAGKFCPKCGCKREEDSFWICPKCKTTNKDAFCENCGEKKPK